MDFETLTANQRIFFASGKTRNIAFRKEQLDKLGDWIKRNDERIMAALTADLGKARFEGYATEIGVVLDDLRYIRHRLGHWARDKTVVSPLKQFPSRSFKRPEPYGCVLILSPWNYPFMLTVGPLLGAIAAGNCAVVKPSAYSPNSSAILAEMARACFSPEYIAVVEGGREENRALLEQRYDYIFFTGSIAVGKTVMAAAAKNLTPLTLELGGKSPCIVDESANIPLAARRIAWGKYLNAGQTCVAPDYLLVHKNVKDRLLKELAACVETFYGKSPLDSPDCPKMINQKHFDRVLGLTRGEHFLFGGVSDPARLKIAPAALDNISFDSPVMQEEIFGPVLPVLTFENLREAVDKVAILPRPLALYVFTTKRENERFVLNSLRFGGGCVNDTVVHLATSHMPFGGVGESGMGGYHGKDSFRTFSHYKSIMKKSNLIDLPLRYPPYKEIYLKLLKRM